MPFRSGNELEGAIHIYNPFPVSRNLKYINCAFSFPSTGGLQIMPLYLHYSFVGAWFLVTSNVTPQTVLSHMAKLRT